MPRDRGRRTDYTWSGNSVGLAIAANGTTLTSIVVVGSAGTIMRSRGELVASIDGPVDNDKTLVAFGLIKVTEEQVVVGFTSVPNPNDDPDAAWLWHGFIPLGSQAIVNQAAGYEVGRLTVDSKAMRKMKQTEAIALVIDNLALAGTPAIDVVGGFRILIGT